MPVSHAFTQIVQLASICKCCNAQALLVGVTDFNRHCEMRNGVWLPYTGIPIYYFRCTACGMIFTTAFDQFTVADSKKWIYNEQYVKVDPDYIKTRPEFMADKISNFLGDPGKPLRILDYGGGTGVFTTRLREAGFLSVESYDPFVAEASAKPAGKFDLIICIEVMEHTTNPLQTLTEMLSMLQSPGAILFSTLIQPDDIMTIGMGWWYIAPRNGHASLYSKASLAALARRAGIRCASFDENFHLFVGQVPEFAKRWFGNNPIGD